MVQEWQTKQVLLLSCPVLSSHVLCPVLCLVLCPGPQPVLRPVLCPVNPIFQVYSARARPLLGHSQPPHGRHGVGHQSGTAPVLSCHILCPFPCPVLCPFPCPVLRP